MVESRLEPKKLSARDRLCLKQTLCALPKPQFDDLVFALNPPKGNVPGSQACQSDRVMALLEWVESAIGPGLIELEAFLQSIIATHTKTSKQYLLLSFDMELSKYTAEEVRAIVELLRKKTGDDSIDVAFFREGSIKVVLSGSPEGLERLRELLESGELEELGLPPMEGVERVEGESEDARKARLVQVLRIRVRARDRIGALDLLGAIGLAVTIARELPLDRNLALALDRTSDLPLGLIREHVSEVALALDCTIPHSSTSDLDRALASACDHAGALVRALDLAIASDQALDRADAIANASVNARAFADSLDRASALALDYVNISNFELSGANLSNLDLKGVDLTGADLTYADVMGTRFGGNPGLTEADKRDLISRGAIFDEPPTSDVPSLVNV